MRENLIVSSRGQVTLPAALRRRLGIKPGGVVIAEERDGELVLRPAVVVEMKVYSDTDITEWDEKDRLDDAERAAILKRLGAKS